MAKPKKCNTCKVIKVIKAFGKCQNCHHRYKNRFDFNFFIRQKYSQIKQRCTNPNRADYHRYKNKLKMTLEEFYNFSIKDKRLKRLWKKAQTDTRAKAYPSIDRIDNSGTYNINNIQWLSWGKNKKKDQKTRPVTVYKTTGRKLKTFISIAKAADHYKVEKNNAWKVLVGQRNHVNGYVFRDADENT